LEQIGRGQLAHARCWVLRDRAGESKDRRDPNLWTSTVPASGRGGGVPPVFWELHSGREHLRFGAEVFFEHKAPWSTRWSNRGSPSGESPIDHWSICSWRNVPSGSVRRLSIDS